MGQPEPPITHVKDAALYGYQRERVFRFRHGSTLDGRPCTEMRSWTGGYRGKGWLKGEGVLFCNDECATYFAVAAYRDGIRINRVGSWPRSPRSQPRRRGHQVPENGPEGRGPCHRSGVRHHDPHSPGR
jgi:hypothetical protein